MARISVYIIAYNEADKIEPALKSVTWADEIVVADSHSTDGTVEIARKYTDRVLQVPFEGFGKLRNDVLAQLTGDWVFSLDADERCTEAAAAEIRRIVEQSDAADAYHIPRRNFLLGRWIRHSGWYPDYRQPQLFRRGKLRYSEDAVHETYILDGTLATMTEPIAQVPFKDLEQIVHKMQRYSTLGVERLAQREHLGHRWARHSRTGSAPSFVITSFDSASSMAGPDSSSPSRTSKARSIATPSTPSACRS